MTERDYGIDASDFRQAAEALSAAGYQRVAGKATAAGLRTAANAVRRKVRARARPHRITGKLHSHIRSKPSGYGLRLNVKVYAAGSVAGLIVHGARPHPIAGPVMPLRARGRAGIQGFTRAVEHPGFRADPFFAQGIQDAVPEINAAVKDAADTMVSALVAQIDGGR